MADRRVRDIDSQIGERIREARYAQSMSQTLLADRLGISFQQIQKYEKGTNRLFDIAHVLGMPITYFYEGAEPFIRSAQRRKARTTRRILTKNR